ncbi:MAG TPA: hypothetical protein VI913_01120 [Candidatus Peribacteraceae bacterium]|nr:hypothetical protein [Candidatus Peribacteraceae bacterium]
MKHLHHSVLSPNVLLDALEDEEGSHVFDSEEASEDEGSDVLGRREDVIDGMEDIRRHFEETLEAA